MANNATGNPWYIDTVGFSFKSPVYVQNLNWNSPAAGATLLIQDNQGRTIVNFTASTADPSFNFGSIKWVQGFNVVTMTSGNLQVVVQK